MSTSSNTLLEQGIQEVSRLTGRISQLAEQEAAFRGSAAAMAALHDTLREVREELEQLNCKRETMKWKTVWFCLGGLGLLQGATLLVILLQR
jgi:hypothetical protein